VSDVADRLAAALGSLVGVPCNRSLTVSSLKLSFDFSQRTKGRAYIWIDPPWRLVCDGRFVTGSYDCPEWDGIEDPEINRPLWEAWCRLLDPLNDVSLAAAIIGQELPDLRLKFTQGYEVQTFGNDGNDIWWYYRDRVTGECFEAKAAGIVHEIGEPAKD
jgi:hypothetical protein